MNRLIAPFAALSCVFAATLAAHAAPAPPVGALSCTGSSDPLTANLSYWDLSASVPAGSGSVGKATQSLVVHASLSQFTSFYTATLQGLEYTCVLTSSAGGAAVTLTFKPAVIQSVTAIAVEGNATALGGTGHANGEAYIEANIAFTNVSVVTSGADDGGITASRSPQLMH